MVACTCWFFLKPANYELKFVNGVGIDLLAFKQGTTVWHEICNLQKLKSLVSRLTIVSREAKKKQAVRNERLSYLHLAPL